jgi:spermidine/putrescine transport system ATP-binding protein
MSVDASRARPAPPADTLSLRQLSRIFAGKPAVDRIDLDIRLGEFFTIVGPSGSGKSTLVRMLAGLERPSSGDIVLRGQRLNEVPANRRPSCMVFQSLALFSHMCVGRNIEFALTMRRVDPATRKARALELMDLVHLPRDFYAKPVTQCSGGERQRVALARALASDPEILFFDEPLSAIDYRLRKILEMEMKDLHRQTGKTFVYITHSLEEAMVMSDRIAVMRAGRIVQLGEPRAIYHAPRSRFVAEFMGEVNILELAPSDGGWRLAELDLVLPAPPPDARPGWIVLRPERMRLLESGSDAQVAFAARMVNDYALGSRTHIHVTAAGRTFIAEVPGGAAVPPAGAEVRIGFDLADAVVVDT